MKGKGRENRRNGRMLCVVYVYNGRRKVQWKEWIWKVNVGMLGLERARDDDYVAQHEIWLDGTGREKGERRRLWEAIKWAHHPVFLSHLERDLAGRVV